MQPRQAFAVFTLTLGGSLVVGFCVFSLTPQLLRGATMRAVTARDSLLVAAQLLSALLPLAVGLAYALVRAEHGESE
jgi:hypothetical protein